MARRYRFLALIGLLALLAGYARWVRPGRLEQGFPTGGAEWIWAGEAAVGPDLTSSHGRGYWIGSALAWTNFFVYKDFSLSGEPAKARLLIQADEAYWVFVNGRPVGSGAFAESGVVDAYEVAPFLRAGENRVLVQLRSRRRVGGLLATLDLEDGHRIPSDRTWRASGRYEAKMQTAGFVAEDERAVTVWGRPPVGSWPDPAESVAVPVLGQQVLASGARGPERVRYLGESLWERRFPEPNRRMPLGRWVVFDMGTAVSGYLNVVLAEPKGARGLVYLGHERVPSPDNSDPATWFRAPPGRGSWSDFEPRRFRFVAVLADAEIAGLRVFETRTDSVVGSRHRSPRTERALGLEPPPSGSTVEDEFWRELERVTGIAGREALESFPRG